MQVGPLGRFDLGKNRPEVHGEMKATGEQGYQSDVGRCARFATDQKCSRGQHCNL